MNRRVRIGILGCASIAMKSTISAFQSIDNAKVVSIASRNIEKAERYASIFSIPHYESYESLVNNPKIDAVYIPLPIGLHKEWIINSAKAGKHILSEKSLTTDFKSTQEIISVCNEKNVILFENIMCDYHPQHTKVLSLIKKGEIGNTFLFRGYSGIPRIQENSSRYNKSLGGGSLNETGLYPIFMARKLFNDEPVSVTAKLFFDEAKGVDIHGFVQMEFKKEKIAHIAFSLDALYQNNYSIWGKKGLISVKRAYAIPYNMKPEVELIKNENYIESIVQIDIPAANHFELIFTDFCNTILNSTPRKATSIYNKILSQAKVLEAIRISSQEGRKVVLDEEGLLQPIATNFQTLRALRR